MNTNPDDLMKTGEQRELECFLASIAFDVDDSDEDFALQIKNEDEARHEFLMRIATGEMVPDRFCKFDTSTLENVSNDAQMGKPLLQSHGYKQVPLGYTFLGEYVSSKQHSNAAAYIIKGLPLNNDYTYSESDAYILALVQKGIREVSMGISGGTAVCNICEGNYYNYRECQHWGGREYPKGRNKTMTLCFYTLFDSHLDEVSFVANGAVPGAIILKGQRMLHDKEIDINDISNTFSKHYKSLDVAETFATKNVFSLNPTKAEPTSEELSSEQNKEQSEMSVEKTITSLQSAHPNLNIPTDPSEALNALATGLAASKATVETQTGTITQLQEQNNKLQLSASDGQTYRQEWRKKAEEAHIAYFDQTLAEVYVSLFDNESTPASEIKKYAEKWQSDLETLNSNQTQNNGTVQTGQGTPKTVEGGNQGQGPTSVLLPRSRPLS